MTNLEELLHFKNLLESQEYANNDIRHMKGSLIRDLGYIIEKEERLHKSRKLVWTKIYHMPIEEDEYISEDKTINLYFEITLEGDSEDGQCWLGAYNKTIKGKNYIYNNLCETLDEAQCIAENIFEENKTK